MSSLLNKINNFYQKGKTHRRKLKQKTHIVVGTPGRVLDHIKRGSLNVSKIDYFVIDEADEMLNMGFQEDVEKIY